MEDVGVIDTPRARKLLHIIGNPDVLLRCKPGRAETCDR
jgi:hypothetical protein